MTRLTGEATFVRDLAHGRITVHETDGRGISIDLKKDYSGPLTLAASEKDDNLITYVKAHSF